MIQDLKRKIVQAAYDAKEGHIASAFSVLDILWILYNGILGPDDRFILSKGHASLALYAVLGLDLTDFGRFNSLLGGHPDRLKAPGVIVSSGSLGHGLPMAVGIALSRKIKGATGRVFCLIGDGECNEGAIWESCLLAAHHKLDNLCLIVDYNHSNDRAINLEGLVNKFISFEFTSYYVIGHSRADLETAFGAPTHKKPVAIVAETIKGYGCKRMENNPEWHHKVPTKVELDEILAELGCADNS